MTGGLGIAGRIARAFVDSKLTQLAMVAALLLGVFAVLATPREEEPQIIVPFADVFVEMPGADVREMEERVAIPLEKKLREIPGVEYVYSISRPGATVAIVRFYVGQNLEDSLVKLYNKLSSNFDVIPAGASQPLIKPRSIDDVPILALTLWSSRADGFALRRIAAQLDEEIKAIPDVSETRLIGGLRRQLGVTLDRDRMAGYGVDTSAVLGALGESNRELRAGSFAQGNREYVVDAGAFLDRAADVGRVIVGVAAGRPVYLRDVAAVDDGPEEPRDYVLMIPGRSGRGGGEPVPAVTLTVAKRQGTNAVVIAEHVLDRLQAVRGAIVPADVDVTVTRNYGETAREKSNELLKHLLLATLSVTVLIAFFLGIRASLVVLVAIPVTLCLTLFLYYLYGYTLNRVTLFALIFSIGILVDDAIVVVENIARHVHLPDNHGRPRMVVAVEAVDEVGNPTILATFAVIAAILPMAFVGGLMGPYMRPIPVGASVAMLFSLFIAFIISPWAAARLLTPGAAQPEGGEGREDWMTRLYRRLMVPLLEDWKRRAVFFCAMLVLLLGACSLVVIKVVRAKMLPFDNKSELQVIVDMPEGTTLEETARVTRELAQSLAGVPEVRDLQLYVGTAAPYNFNGLIRHYFPPIRQGPNVADIQVNLVSKGERRAQSHDIARRVRPALQEIALRSGARIKVAEVPPGPPVLQTLVAEVYAADPTLQMEVSRRVLQIFERTPGVVDVDWYVEDPQPGFRFTLDKEKAALHGISTEQMVQALRVALSGSSPGLFHLPKEKEDVPIVVRLPRSQRSGVEALQGLKLRGRSGALVPLSELARVEPTLQPPFVYRKNLQRVVYVTGDVAGREESPVYAILTMNQALGALRLPDGQAVPVHLSGQPLPSRGAAVKWDGEWQVTYEVFRDLGVAFAAVMVLIYILVVAWFRSFITPLVIMAPIPLTLVGILPAHFLMGAFFTATSMIGFIAGAGIIVRNSIILVDFIELRRRQGMPLAEAVVDAGAVRFRPMLLTASAVVVGASVMLFDPIFQGLAISLMAGEVASTLLSRMAVPLFFYLAERGRDRARGGALAAAAA
ncbi:MAG: efflux RND transporter permease subunit [Candidatus Rokubacteria bacterium]|nr:efflux RND transporter permease subunit [Candidatus Rokubacteria bacterium]